MPFNRPSVTNRRSPRETIVLESERRPGEDLLCVNEVDVVSLQITSTFPRIPRESHMQIVYTNLAMRKRSRTPLLMHRTTASDELALGHFRCSPTLPKMPPRKGMAGS
jgi:hypothetical protein